VLEETNEIKFGIGRTLIALKTELSKIRPFASFDVLSRPLPSNLLHFGARAKSFSLALSNFSA